MRRLRAMLLTLALAVLLVLALWIAMRGMPGKPLDLGDIPGRGTGERLVKLRDDFPRCKALLDRAGVVFQPLAPRRDGPRCGYADAVSFGSGGARRIAFDPRGLGVSCSVAAALAMWEWNVVQPAALRHFGRPVTAIDHFGSYNCRRMYGRDTGNWSEHATADAVDIAAFRLADGMRVSVVNDWQPPGAKAQFLREVRDGACPLFATVLSPDYNAAHRDHFHLDQARRTWGWRACR